MVSVVILVTRPPERNADSPTPPSDEVAAG
jgi:hypothetical protein